jgi:hypothetical protein
MPAHTGLALMCSADNLADGRALMAGLVPQVAIINLGLPDGVTLIPEHTGAAGHLMTALHPSRSWCPT